MPRNSLSLSLYLSLRSAGETEAADISDSHTCGVHVALNSPHEKEMSANEHARQAGAYM